MVGTDPVLVVVVVALTGILHLVLADSFPLNGPEDDNVALP